MTPPTHPGSSTANDDLAWLRDPRWTEVLRDPQKLSPHIRAHLDAENAHTELVLRPATKLRRRLWQELASRMPEESETVGVADGPFTYFERRQRGQEHPALLRRATSGGAGPELLVDLDAESRAMPGLRLVRAAPAPDHCHFAFSLDAGSGRCEIRIRRIGAPPLPEQTLSDTSGAFTWSPDAGSLLYVALDARQRPRQLRLHRLGGAAGADRDLYQEPDEGFFVTPHLPVARRFFIFSAADHTTSEVFVAATDDSALSVRSVAGRHPGLRYEARETDDGFCILSNRGGAADHEIAFADFDCRDPSEWRTVVPCRPGEPIVDWAVTRTHLAWIALRDGRPHAFVLRRTEGGITSVPLPAEEGLDLRFAPGPVRGGHDLRFTCSSPRHPPRVYDYAPDQSRLTLRQVDGAGNHDPEDYVCERLFAPTTDGERVPITVTHHRATRRDGSAPLLLEGYGAYGVSLRACWRPEVMSLVDRGFVHALAHVRGGSERGTRWHLDGRGPAKSNSFDDFLASASYLIERRFTSAGGIACRGASAGGMLVGVAINRRPDLFKAAVAEVPFVDVLATMSDPSLPLTPREWPEWGNPCTAPDTRDAIAAWCPVSNVRTGRYPAVLATAGLTDPYVGYWEPARWVARLRRAQIGPAPILLQTRMTAGHLGSSARSARLDEAATIGAFLLLAYDLDRDTEEASHDRNVRNVG